VARFKRTTTGSAPADNDNSSNADAGWNTLEELRQIMTAKGCAKAQFDQALEAVGENPHSVANYLQRYAFVRDTQKITNSG
jgi:hypothetical protein